MSLSDNLIRKAKPKKKPYRLFDGHGFYLEVSPTGGKLWRWKYRNGPKEKRLSLGTYPNVSLKAARDKCYVALERLEESGHEMRRPIADYLQNGIYELRVHFRHVNYRILYFFAGRRIVVVSHGLIKEQRVPAKQIELAGRRRQAFLTHPKLHTFVPGQ